MGRLTGLAGRLDFTEAEWIGDRSVSLLRELGALEKLILTETSVTDDGLAHVGALTGLRLLDLTGTAVSGRGLARFGPLTRLMWLELWGCDGVDTEALEPLAGLTSLRWLGIGSTPLAESNEAVRRLRQALPATEIRTDDLLDCPH